MFPLTTPPLRDRIEDIPLLVYFLNDKYAMKIGKKITGISESAMQRLQSYRWPGNIRELENIIERAVILADNPIIDIESEMLSNRGYSSDQPEITNNASFEAVSRQLILSVLEQTR